MLLTCGVGEDSWESLGLQGDQASQSYRKSILNIHWKDVYLSCNSDNLTTWCKELTHLKRPWCLERLKAGGEEDDRGSDGWMASLTRGTWVWASSGRWWRSQKPGILHCIGSQKSDMTEWLLHILILVTSLSLNMGLWSPPPCFTSYLICFVWRCIPNF